MSIADPKGGSKAPYFELIHRFPLRPLRSDDELDRAVAVLDSLLARPNLTQEEQDYLEVLSDLVEKYESEVHPMRPVSDAELLRHLIEAKGVTQSELAEATGIVNSTISEVLNGKRHLNREHIGKLSRYFRVSPEAFAF